MLGTKIVSCGPCLPFFVLAGVLYDYHRDRLGLEWLYAPLAACGNYSPLLGKLMAFSPCMLGELLCPLVRADHVSETKSFVEHFCPFMDQYL